MINFQGFVIGIPLSLDCNLNTCKYCFRSREVIREIPKFTDDMINLLKSLTPDTCKGVAVTGGEPLVHFDKVKEVFSYVPKDVEKKILSNGTLLTQEIVDYINENNIQYQISHDGPQTKFLRGVDILLNPKIVDLLRQIKRLRCSCVITKYNVDVWENYFYLVKKLGRNDIVWAGFPVMDLNPDVDLISDFDFEKWFETWMQFKASPYNLMPRYRPLTRKFNFNVLPNGQICSCIRFSSDYGTIHGNDIKEAYEKLKTQTPDLDYCIKTNCEFINNCRFGAQGCSDFVCKCRRIVMQRCVPATMEKMIEYVNEHLDEIKEKYGYVEP